MFINKVIHVIRRNVSSETVKKSNTLLLNGYTSNFRYSSKRNFRYFSYEQKLKRNRFLLLLFIPCFVTSLVSWKR